MLSEKLSFDASDLESIARKLDGQRQSNGSWKCKCPLHDDRTHSLSISLGDSTPLVVHCFAGCDDKRVWEHVRELHGKPLTEKKEQPKVIPIGKNSKPTAQYGYYDADKKLLFHKLRYDLGNGEKTFRYRYELDGKQIYKKPDGIGPQLYYLVKFLRLTNAPVIICEGEKDCDTLNQILGDDYVAITNDTGGSQWPAELAKLMDGRTVIIAEDCDRPGRERTSKIIKAGGFKSLLGVLRFTQEEVGEKGDVSDWIAKGATAAQLRERLSNGLAEKDSVTTRDGKEKKGEASREDYIALFTSRFGEMKRDIFSDTLMYRDNKRKRWAPVANSLGLVRSDARVLTNTTKQKYSPSAVNDHFDHVVDDYEPVVIPEIPEWDGEDRLAEMTSMLVMNQAHDISQEDVYAVLCEWMANIWRKIDDPTMDESYESRSFIFILQSEKEKIGKDSWIRMLLCGFDQWLIEFSHGANERDTLAQIHDAAVLCVSEFDKLCRYESSFVKDIVTRPSSKARKAYGRESEHRFSRCSFIASVNPLDILRDTGGNSRFCIIPIDGVNFKGRRKSVAYSLQCLAQGRALKEEGYVAPELNWSPIRALVRDITPESINDEIADWFEAAVAKWLASTGDMAFDFELKNEILERGYVTKDEVDHILEMGCRIYKRTRDRLLHSLYSAGLKTRVGNTGMRCLKLSRK